jgi:hypothetical protein
MEPESSLPHSQVAATCPYPEPARSSPSPLIPLPEDPPNISSHLRLSPPPHMLHAQPISFIVYYFYDFERSNMFNVKEEEEEEEEEEN